MKRHEFIKLCAALGLSLPLQPVLNACTSTNGSGSGGNFDGSVLIIGAGAGGITTGHLLAQRGIDFRILEASSRWGGRMKTTNSFVDFPISLGGEWLHVQKSILDQAVNDSSVEVAIETTPYDPAVDYGLFNGNQISLAEVGFTIDQKFIGSSWLDFFREYLLPSVEDRIQYNEVVTSIDYSGDQVNVTTSNGSYSADKVVINAPVKIIQEGDISFNPPLPQNKQNAFENVRIWDGFKAFIEFSEKFYPAFTAFEFTPETAGQKLYYDAAYGQNSSRHVLGLFSVGEGTLPYRKLNNSALIDYMLDELDGIYNGQASANYIQHTSQNWNEEPFARGAYLVDHENWRSVRTLGDSVADKLYFAGCSYTDGEDWSSVHTAIQSGIRAVNELS